MTARRTDELTPGDVLVIGRGLVRTVDRVVPNGYLNGRGEALYNVMYAEGWTPEWSEGNSGAPGTLWELAAMCSANVGGDPASGCEEWAVPGSDYCPAHDRASAT